MISIEVKSRQLSHLPLLASYPYKRTTGESNTFKLELNGACTVRQFSGMGVFRFSPEDRKVHVVFVEDERVRGLIQVFNGFREIESETRNLFEIAAFSLAIERSNNGFYSALYVNTRTRHAIEFKV